jgi:hypothetical protein
MYLDVEKCFPEKEKLTQQLILMRLKPNQELPLSKHLAHPVD